MASSGADVELELADVELELADVELELEPYYKKIHASPLKANAKHPLSLKTYSKKCLNVTV